MRTLIKLLAIIYISYLALVALILIPALNILPPLLVKDAVDRDLQSEIILFNPFTLALEVRKARLPEQDGSPFVTLDSAEINLSMASLWRPGIVFDEVAVAGLYVHVKQLTDGSFNFSDMIPPTDPDEPPAEPVAIPGITIDRFSFQSERIQYTSEAREQAHSTHLDGLAIGIDGLSTILEEGRPYRLDAAGDGGGKLHWEGEVSLPKAYSEGSLALTRIQLRPFWRFIEPWVKFEVADGDVSVEGRYRVSWGDTLSYRVSQGELRVQDVALQPKPGEDLAETRIALAGITLAGIELDGPAQHVDVNSLTVDALAIEGWSQGDRVSLVELFAVDLPQDDSGDAPAAAADAATEPGWTAALGSFNLQDSAVRWRSEFTAPALLDITPIELTAQPLKWPLGGDTGLKLQLSVNGQTSVSVEGSLDLALGNGALAYQLADLPLPWFSPNLPDALQAEITDGQLDITGDVTLAGYAPGVVQMDGAISGFSGKLTDTETSLTSWETVRWKKLVVDLEQHTVDLARLSIDDYQGRIHINKDGSINAQNVWRAEVGEQADAVAEELAVGKPWTVNVPKIRLTDSEIDFMDESLPISFRTVIGDLNGDITGISTRPGAITKVDIKGSVDGYAPVVLAGTAEPLRSPLALDLRLTFEGVDMALLTPYSGTYAGYAIERGVLNLDLEYAMQDNQLKGNNKVVINQMKLGEKITSDKAADLPLKLALALLTDSQGVIDLAVPVSGDVDNPQFNIGSVVAGAFMNLLTKAITSPFTLLASLVDSEQDLQRINFSSGSSELKEPAKAKLDDLSKAMAERPGLDLAITGRLQLKADRERLQKNRLQEELLAAGLSQQELATKGPAWEQAIEARFQAQAPGASELTVREQYLQLAQAIPLPDSALLELAEARAVAVKTYLVNAAGLAPDRAVIATGKLQDKANLYSGVELEIDI